MYQFPDSWTDEIASVSELYQNATVTLLDDSLVTKEYVTDVGWVITGDAEFWTGQARIMPMRWGVNRENSDFGNSLTQTAVLVQFEKNTNFGATPDPFRIKRGVGMIVNACPDNPSLLSMYFRSGAEVQGSNAASRTIEFSVSGDSEVTNA